MSKHTPGEWFIKYNWKPNPPSIWAKISKTGSMKLCDICGMSEFDFANARLIAAAPELLEALKNVISFWPHTESETPWGLALGMAKKAIAKAEGSE